MKVQAKKVQMTEEIRRAVLAQLDKAVYYGGEQAYWFERELAAYLGVKHVLTLNSGTSALLVASMACQIGRGDDVLVPANVYNSTAEVPAFLGATPVFCDVDEDTANVTAESLSARMTSRTKAIILTHLYGHPADMDPIMALARQYNLRVIEIGAHALGGEYKRRKVGCLADIGVFSLSSKNISVCSSGGAVSTNSAEWYEAMLLTSRHGWRRLPVDETFFHQVQFEDSPMVGMLPVDRDSIRPGLNLQLDEIPCAVGRIAMKSLDEWNERRRQFARRYTELLSEAAVPVHPLRLKPWAKHAYLHYVVRASDRDDLLRYLLGADIEARVHYPILLPEMRYYRQEFPTRPELYAMARRLLREIITLPVHPWLTDREIQYVVGKVADFYRSH